MSQEEWVPCVFELETEPGKVASSTWTIRNIDATETNLSYVLPLPNATETNLSYVLPLPTRRGGQRLHLSGITVGVQDASPGNSVPSFHARGITFNQSVVLEGTKHGAVGAPAKVEHNFPVIDCSVYDVVKVVVYLECTEKHGVDISFVTAKCYYA
jgi:hypothetical protein